MQVQFMMKKTNQLIENWLYRIHELRVFVYYQVYGFTKILLDFYGLYRN